MARLKYCVRLEVNFNSRGKIVSAEVEANLGRPFVSVWSVRRWVKAGKFTFPAPLRKRMFVMDDRRRERGGVVFFYPKKDIVAQVLLDLIGAKI